MAKPIKETPTLYGKDATQFLKKMAESEKHQTSKPEYDKIMANYNKIKSQIKF
jgi:hypothetical protein